MLNVKWLLFVVVTATLISLNTEKAFAVSYHVSMQGDDSNAGTRAHPFRTIQKAAGIMTAGDTCLVHAGIYRESVHPAHSGTADLPITIKAYRGETVVVSGADLIENVTRDEAGVLSASVDGPVEQVFDDGVMINVARWPNSPLDPMRPVWAEAGEGTTRGKIVDASIPNTDLAGAKIWVLPGRHWITWTRPVQQTDVSAHTIQFSSDWSQDDAYAVQKGTRYVVFGAKSLLDTPGEWYWDAASKALTILPLNDGKKGADRIEVKRRDFAFDLTKCEYIAIDGFRVFASAINLSDAAHCTIDNCHLRYATHFIQSDGWGASASSTSGILVSGHDNVVQRCSVIYSAGNGISVSGQDNQIDDCLVRGADYSAVDYGAVWADGTRNTISHCTLCNCARSVLLHRTLKAGHIAYNDMYYAGMMTTDLGITYCYSTDGEDTIIDHNWLHDNLAAHVGVGLYIDNLSSRFLIHHNVSWNNPDSGIRLNTPSHNNWVYNNTALNNGNSVSYWGPEGTKDEAGCRLMNNLFNNDVVTGEGIEISNNATGKAVAVRSIERRDFRIKDGAPGVDAGVVIPGITAGFRGKAPDAGAYESGAPLWRAGHSWGEPPVF